MKKILMLGLAASTLLFACKKSNNIVSSSNNVLLLKVDYQTNAFEGGIDYNFVQQSNNFTVTATDTPATDFGSVKVLYNEINETLFYGTVHWMGLGEMKTPMSILPAVNFPSVLTNDHITPVNGFEQLFPQYAQGSDYMPAWSSIQHVQKVREYLSSNPNQTVKVFLYTPSVGAGNPADWDWVFIIKK